MGEHKFSIKEAIGRGWEVTKSNFVFFLGILLFVAVLYIVPGILDPLFRDRVAIIGVFVGIAFWVVQRIVDLGMIKIALAFIDGKKPVFKDLFACYPMFLKYIISAILYGLIVLGGTILFIVPGIIWGIMFQFFPYFIVEKNAGPVEALKMSARITKGAKGWLFLLGIVVALISMLGVLALFVGLFVAIPITMIAYAFVYRELLKKADLGGAAPAGPEPAPKPSV